MDRGLARRLVGSPLLGALTAPHGVDRYLELVLPSFSLHDLRAEVVEVRHSIPNSVTLRLRANKLWRGFEAGQFVALTMEIEGVRRTRCYSPAVSQHASDREIEITVRAHPQGLVSRYLQAHARPGMVVELAQPAGDFVLRTPRPERLLLISGGSGITPVLSMLRTLCDEGHAAPVTFLHYARHAYEVAYRSELEQLARRHANVRLAFVYTRQRAGNSRERSQGELRRGVVRGEPYGHLARAQLQALDRRYREAEVYVCGPPGLIAATRALWAGEDLRARVHSESFLAPRVRTSSVRATRAHAMPDENHGSVRFASSNVEIAGGAMTLLEHAEQAGLTPVYGCRMGICHTCTCRKLSGQVRNINSGELSSGEENDIQICVSVPVGDVELAL
jgi:ferredoxin-NADP reductase